MINVTKLIYPEEGVIYSMKGTNGFSDVSIKVDSDDSRGLLFSINLPHKTSFDGGCFSGSTEFPRLQDVLKVLAKIGADFNVNDLKSLNYTIREKK